MIVINGSPNSPPFRRFEFPRLPVSPVLTAEQFPGPLIQANLGDTIVVNVINSISNWSTTMHWHGILQQNTSYMDGVVAYPRLKASLISQRHAMRNTARQKLHV
jgi:FtsP/CotA-like multicopper oxidase with cupredoxin domain